MAELSSTSQLSGALSALTVSSHLLENVIKTLSHTINCSDRDVTIRAHYLPFRNGTPMTGELLEVLRLYLCNFALSKSEIQSVHDSVIGKSQQETMLAYNRLHDSASDLFIKAQKSTNRNGECGELLLYLLIEWVLQAPQVVAKLSLKTNGQMPVHGSDGIHMKYDPKTGEVIFVWGEAKLYKTIDGAIGSAVQSVSDAIKYQKQKEDINLIRRYFDLSGLPAATKDVILDHLNPLSPLYHKKVDLSACLIGFDFAGFSAIKSVKTAELENSFCSLLSTELNKAATTLDSALAANGISHHRMEVFFFPLSSVDQLRIDFQNLIGWKN